MGAGPPAPTAGAGLLSGQASQAGWGRGSGWGGGLLALPPLPPAGPLRAGRLPDFLPPLPADSRAVRGCLWA